MAVERGCTSNILAADSNALYFVTLTFDLILRRVIVIVYPCAEFGDFSFSRFGFIVRRHTNRITDRITEVDDRYILTLLPSV